MLDVTKTIVNMIILNALLGFKGLAEILSDKTRHS